MNPLESGGRGRTSYTRSPDADIELPNRLMFRIVPCKVHSYCKGPRMAEGVCGDNPTCGWQAEIRFFGGTSLNYHKIAENWLVPDASGAGASFLAIFSPVRCGWGERQRIPLAEMLRGAANTTPIIVSAPRFLADEARSQSFPGNPSKKIGLKSRPGLRITRIEPRLPYQ